MGWNISRIALKVNADASLRVTKVPKFEPVKAKRRSRSSGTQCLTPVHFEVCLICLTEYFCKTPPSTLLFPGRAPATCSSPDSGFRPGKMHDAVRKLLHWLLLHRVLYRRQTGLIGRSLAKTCFLCPKSRLDNKAAIRYFNPTCFYDNENCR